MPVEPVYLEERRSAILSLIAQRKKVQVADLVEMFKVSATSIRNDLRALEEANLLLRTHGGAIEKPQTRLEVAMQERRNQLPNEKKVIAKAALEHIHDGDTILLDTGTTTLQLAHLLSERKHLTVITNDIAIAAVLEEFESINVFVIGGVLRKGFHCTLSLQMGVGSSFGSLNVDKGFFGTNGFSLEAGATTPDLGQAASKIEMLKMARKVYILCDHDKLGRVSFSRFADASEVDTVVTDSIDETLLAQMEEAGIEVVCPNGPTSAA